MHALSKEAQQLLVKKAQFNHQVGGFYSICLGTNILRSKDTQDLRHQIEALLLLMLTKKVEARLVEETKSSPT